MTKLTTRMNAHKSARTRIIQPHTHNQFPRKDDLKIDPFRENIMCTEYSWDFTCRHSVVMEKWLCDDPRRRGHITTNMSARHPSNRQCPGCLGKTVILSFMQVLRHVCPDHRQQLIKLNLEGNVWNFDFHTFLPIRNCPTCRILGSAVLYSGNGYDRGAPPPYAPWRRGR
jgi:hypothetical protein